MYHCTLNAKTFSRLFVQSDPDDPAARSLRRYYAVVPIADIPEEWADWLEVNARDSSDKGRVPTDIRKTLSHSPEWFAAYNRGLTVVASDVRWDNRDNRMELEFEEPEYHGVLDGGHTLRAILDERSRLAGGAQEGFCNIEVFTGLADSEIPGVVEARNTSKQVASKSLLNLQGAFEGLKSAIGEKADIITWKENEEGVFDVRELVGILTALDPSTVGENAHPIRAYSGKEACLKRFRDFPQSFEKMFGIASDALEMWDSIQFWLPSQYNRMGRDPDTPQGGRLGGLTGIQWIPAKPTVLPFIDKTTDYSIPTAYIYPVLSAFRAMLVDKDGEWAWDEGIDPISLIEQGAAARIFIRSVREAIETLRNPNRIGKDAQTWNTAYMAARIMYLERNSPEAR